MLCVRPGPPATERCRVSQSSAGNPAWKPSQPSVRPTSAAVHPSLLSLPSLAGRGGEEGEAVRLWGSSVVTLTWPSSVRSPALTPPLTVRQTSVTAGQQ